VHLANLVILVSNVAEAPAETFAGREGMRVPVYFGLASLFMLFAGFRIAMSRFDGFDLMKSCWGWGIGIVLTLVGLFAGNYWVAAFGMVTLVAVGYATARLAGRLPGVIVGQPEEPPTKDSSP
jgi:hypothetical protein